MSSKAWIFWIAIPILGIMVLVARPVPVAADSHPQVTYQTPTARPDGRVIYIVQENDTCLRIQLLTNTTIDQIRTLNKLDQNCTINPGQELLLMVVTPAASPTPNPKISPTPLLPTPTPKKGDGKICVILFDDVNGNAVHEDGEPPLGGGAVSISDRQASFSKTINTTADPETTICEDVPEGEYNVSVAIPSGYNATKAMNAVVQVQAGDQAIFEFGAQVSSLLPQSPETSGGVEKPQANNSLPLAILGGLLVLGGVGLGGYILFTRRSPTGQNPLPKE
jgi:LysM repeat protein